ncbi:ice-binding family protein [Pacificibacter sp. AS14]|uniref:ice-binding family protein n=1 Tax=Pacificibacter sp. AS14 TaxID=3135785 RepID=UPI00317C4D39
MSLTTRSTAICFLAISPLSFLTANPGYAQELPSFALIAGQSLSNTGPTTIDGNIAVSPGISYTGSGSVTQTGTTFIGDAVGVRLQDDLTTLYNFLSGRPTSTGGDLTGQDLGGMTLLPGVYNFDSGALLSAGQTLTFDAGGDPNAIFIINIGSTLTAGSGTSVVLVNGAQGGNIFYRVGSSATLDTSADFYGQIVALTSISLNTAATLDCGSAFARNGSITLDTNTIGTCVLEGVSFIDVISDGEATDDDDPVDDDDTGSDPTDDGTDDGTTDDGTDDGTTDDGTDDDGTDDGTDDDGTDDGTDGGTTDDGSGDDGTTDDDTPIIDAALREVLPDNALNVARALALREIESGSIPQSFGILSSVLTRAELSASLVQLSGEVSTGVSQMGFQSMNTLIDLVTRAPQTSRQQLAPAQDNEAPIGSVRDRSNDYTSKYDAVPAGSVSGSDATAAPQTQNWGVWASGYGSKSEAEGSAATGNQNRTIYTSGLAVGVEIFADAYSTFGAALAFDQGSLTLEDGLASAESDSVSFAVFGTRDFDRGYVSGALAYGRNDVTTDRTISVAGIDQFRGEVTTSNLAGHVEAGYFMGTFTPFVSLRAQSLKAPAYSETTVSGSSTYALDYAAQTTRSLRSELGVAVKLAENDSTSLRLRASWAHEFNTSTQTNATFQAISGISFTTSGAAPSSDSLILGLNGEYGGPSGFYASSNLVTIYSGDTPDFGGSVRVGYRW